MIKNDRQLATSERKLHDLELDMAATTGWEHENYERLASQIRHEIHEYRAVSMGLIREFPVTCVDDLADVLVKARNARSLTQKQLAERLEVQEQSVQRDESGGYDSATLPRLADVADALGYRLQGSLVPLETATRESVTGNGLPIVTTWSGGLKQIHSKSEGTNIQAFVHYAGRCEA